MNILLIYFTGTYHTRYLTDRLAERFEREGHAVIRHEFFGESGCKTEGFDLVGIGYPIHGFNSPMVFNRFLRGLTFGRGQPYFLYKNSGETFAVNNASSRVIKRLMRKKGAVLRGEYHFVLPYNIHFPYQPDFVRELLYYDSKLTEVLIFDLTHGRTRLIRSNFWYDLASFFVSVQKIGGPVNSFLYRADPDRCRRCGLCAKRCPTRNITLREDGLPRFGHRCAMCMRCSFCCPADAISIGFLQGWKVNGEYHLDRVPQGPPERPYITDQSRGFYACFPRTYREIEAAFSEVCRLKEEAGEPLPELERPQSAPFAGKAREEEPASLPGKL